MTGVLIGGLIWLAVACIAGLLVARFMRVGRGGSEAPAPGACPVSGLGCADCRSACKLA